MLKEGYHAQKRYPRHDVTVSKAKPKHFDYSVLAVSLSTYLTKFQWEMAKFPIKQSLRGIVDAIGQQASQVETDLKTKAQTYNNLKSNLTNMERKQT